MGVSRSWYLTPARRNCERLSCLAENALWVCSRDGTPAPALLRRRGGGTERHPARRSACMSLSLRSRARSGIWRRNSASSLFRRNREITGPDRAGQTLSQRGARRVAAGGEGGPDRARGRGWGPGVSCASATRRRSRSSFCRRRCGSLRANVRARASPCTIYQRRNASSGSWRARSTWPSPCGLPEQACAGSASSG